SAGWRSASVLSSTTSRGMTRDPLEGGLDTHSDHIAFSCRLSANGLKLRDVPRKSVNPPKPRTAETRKPAPRTPKRLRILMVASEAQPFSKTGGLADVATALPKALSALGHDVTLITPRYRGVTDGPVVATLSLTLAGHPFDARLMEAPV